MTPLYIAFTNPRGVVRFGIFTYQFLLNDKNIDRVLLLLPIGKKGLSQVIDIDGTLLFRQEI